MAGPASHMCDPPQPRQTATVTSLAPIQEHVAALKVLFQALEAEKVMDFDATKETAYLVRASRSSGSAQGELRRWAILDQNQAVVGYLSGRFRGGVPGLDLPDGAVGGFISQVVLSSEGRGAGHAWRSVREFARVAASEANTSIVGLHLDETGDLEDRRTRFERIGFEFSGLIGSAEVNALLAEAEDDGPRN